MTAGIKANADGSAAIQVGGSDAITITSALNTTFAGTVTSASTVAGSTGTLYPLVSGTAVASTSGTSIDFTSIPSWVKRITVMFNGVSVTGASIALQAQIGDSGGIEITGYSSNVGIIAGGYPGATGVDATATAGFLLQYQGQSTGDALSGHLVLTNVSGNIWVSSGTIGNTSGGNRSIYLFNGTKTLSDTLTQVRITTAGGTATFDAGSINILYE